MTKDFLSYAAEILTEKGEKFAEVAEEKTEAFAKAGSKKFKSAADTTKDLATKFFGITKDYSLLLRPLGKNERFSLSRLEPYLNKDEYKLVAAWLKQQKAKISIIKYGWSFLISGKDHLPKLISGEPYTEELNSKIKTIFFRRRFEEFAERAWNAVPQYIAPEMIGNLEIKQAIALQLLSPEPINILLVGNAESGKNELISTTKEVSDHVYGTPEDGVCALIKNHKIFPGLLRQAGNNLCIVRNLHHMRKDDEVMLYRTLETGYVAYNTRQGRKRHPTPASLLTEIPIHEPTADVSEPLFTTSRQATPGSGNPSPLLLDPYMVSKFHCTFFVKPVGLQSFSEIAEKLIMEHKITIKENDADFIKKYCRFAKNLQVEIPQTWAEKIKEFAVKLKEEKELQLPYKISSQLVVGLVRLVKASARSELRTIVEAKDLDRVFRIYEKSMHI